MAEFTLLTSGAVVLPTTHYHPHAFTVWSDLSLFEQGYIEALFASLATPPFTSHPHLRRDGVCYGETIVGFSDLAPETLAAIRKDCAAFNLKIGDASHNRGIGAKFFESRQIGFSKFWSLHQAEMASALPHLTLHLSDDGKVRFAQSEADS